MHIFAEAEEITSLGKFIDVLIFIYVAVATPIMIWYAAKLNKRKLKENKAQDAEGSEEQ